MAHDLGAGVRKILKAWTVREDRVVAEACAAGRSMASVARELGRSRNSCIAHAWRRGYRHAQPFNRRDPMPPPPPEPPAPVEPEPETVDKAALPRWQCRASGCRGTRQPGRDHCAECITEKRRAACP